MFSLRYLALLLLSTGCLFLTILLLYTDCHETGLATFIDHPADSAISVNYTRNSAEGVELLGIASRVYVLSLPARDDRRKDMELLSKSLSAHAGANWSWIYVDATDKTDPVVWRIMDAVRRVRERLQRLGHDSGAVNSSGRGSHGDSLTSHFAWPESVSSKTEKIDQWAPGFLPVDFSRIKGTSMSLPLPEPIVCATQNITITPYTPTLPHHRILTPARVACWHSHVSLIHKIANDDTLDEQESVVVLEDDVDAERDIATRLKGIWALLPREWDIVYLGHCWSNEGLDTPQNASEQAVVTYGRSRNLPTTGSKTRLHLSRNPLCTHAYALSRAGARRILVHLRYPPFAYSRSIDKALAWLVQSKRVKSFSVVPSVVVQRKTAGSDVMPGMGSGWKDVLDNGVFA